MILLDTNVVSEPIREIPDPNVVRWIDSQADKVLYLSAVSVAELRLGVRLLPPGRRRDYLNHRIETEVLPDFEGRVLPFDMTSATVYADLVSHARSVGRPISKFDGLIAATAEAHELTVATRDTRPFETVGLKTINPWQWVS